MEQPSEPLLAHPLVEAALKETKKLAPLLALDVLWHVGLFVVTDKGQLVAHHKATAFPGRKCLQSFGGCSYPNNVVRMMNSLRLELMDESSLTYEKERGFLRASPLIALPGTPDSTLLQVLLFSHDVIQQAIQQGNLWSAERARKYFHNVPLGWSEKVPMQMREAGGGIKCLPWKEARDFPWRKCDKMGFEAVEPVIEELLKHEMSSQMILIKRHPGTPDNVWKRLKALRKLYNQLQHLPALAQAEWRPILWDDADILQTDELRKLL